MAMSNRHLCYNPYVWWAGCQRSQVRLGGLSVGTWLEGVPACEYPSRCSKLTKQERKSIPNSRERRERCIFPLSLSRSWPETHRNLAGHDERMGREGSRPHGPCLRSRRRPRGPVMEQWDTGPSLLEPLCPSTAAFPAVLVLLFSLNCPTLLPTWRTHRLWLAHKRLRT